MEKENNQILVHIQQCILSEKEINEGKSWWLTEMLPRLTRDWGTLLTSTQ